MRTAPFGELLGRLVGLTRLDIDEILADQIGSRRRFGEIALSWGLCSPEDIWKAWCDQLTTKVQRVDLTVMGIDAQAAAIVDRDLALRLGVIPIRCLGDTVIVATAVSDTDQIAAELELATGKTVRFVLADFVQIEQAIKQYLSAEPHSIAAA